MDQPENKARPDLLDRLVPLARQAPLGHRVQLEYKETKVQLEYKETKVQLEYKVQPDRLAPLDQPAHKVQQDRPAPSDQLDPLHHLTYVQSK